MLKVMALLLVLPIVTGCAQQIRLGTNQTRSTIPQIMTDQALSNAAAAYRDPLAIPAQMRLTGSLTSAINTINTGIAPNIALRAIAITGLNLSSSNAITQNWSADPVTNYLDLKRLQIFYNYATTGTGYGSFDAFEAALNRVGDYKVISASMDPDALRNKKDGKIRALPPLSEQIGRLPPGPFIIVNDPNHCRGGIERLTYTYLDRVCFPPGRVVAGSSEPIRPESLLSLFVLWSMAIPQVNTPIDGRLRVVPTPPIAVVQ